MGCSLSSRIVFVVREGVPGQDYDAENEFINTLRLTKDQVDKLYRVFIKVDVNCDFEIDQGEFLAAFRLDRSPFFERLFGIFRADSGHDGISFRQFVRSVYHLSSLDYGGIARLVFESVAGSSGRIRMRELRRLGSEMMTTKQVANPKTRRKMTQSLSPDSQRELFDGGPVTFDAFCRFAESNPAILEQALHIQSYIRQFTLGEETWLKISSKRVARGGYFPAGLDMFADPTPKRTESWWLSPPRTSLVEDPSVGVAAKRDSGKRAGSYAVPSSFRDPVVPLRIRKDYITERTEDEDEDDAEEVAAILTDRDVDEGPRAGSGMGSGAASRDTDVVTRVRSGSSWVASEGDDAGGDVDAVQRAVLRVSGSLHQRSFDSASSGGSRRSASGGGGGHITPTHHQPLRLRSSSHQRFGRSRGSGDEADLVQTLEPAKGPPSEPRRATTSTSLAANPSSVSLPTLNMPLNRSGNNTPPPNTVFEFPPA